MLAQIKDFWHADRKPANVQLVVDVSLSMQEDNKIAQAIKGLQAFLRQLSPRDRVGLLYFNDELHEGVKIAPFATNAPALRSTVDNLIADGSTSLYDATARGVTDVEALARRQPHQRRRRAQRRRGHHLEAGAEAAARTG